MKKLLWLGVLVIFWLTGFRWIDPDFGWHLRMGEIIAKSGIPLTDPFSYTMPSYPFVDYEWLTNLIWHLTFPRVGMEGLAAFYAVAAVAAMWIAVPKWGKKHAWVPLLAGWSVMLGRFGVRPQVINWWFWAVIVRWMFEPELWKKWRWTYPLLMLVWVNLHGSFPLGTVAVGLWLGLKGLQKRELIWKDWLIWGAGLAATLVNPYGWRDWAEVLLVMQQSSLLRAGVQEWAPFYQLFEMGLLMMLVMTGFYIWKYRRKCEWWEGAIALWMIWWAVSGLRYAPLFMIFAAPVGAKFMAELEKLGQATAEGKRRFGIVNRIFIGLAGLAFFTMAGLAVWGRVNFKEEYWYPKGAVNFLQKQQDRGRIFSDYGWGGYLIWKMPGERFFIDGRMSCFDWKAPEGESDQAFKEYLEITQKKEALEKAIGKYRIDTILWPKRAYSQSGSWFTEALDKWIRQIAGLKYEGGADRHYQRVAEWVEELGWVKKYDDDLAAVYVRPEI